MHNKITSRYVQQKSLAFTNLQRNLQIHHWQEISTHLLFSSGRQKKFNKYGEE